jgi:hypothetical protein
VWSKKVIAISSFKSLSLRLGTDAFLALTIEHILQQRASRPERLEIQLQAVDFFLELDRLLLMNILLLVEQLLQLSHAGSSSLTESTLGRAVLCLAFGRRSVCCRFTTRFGTRWDDPFL